MTVLRHTLNSADDACQIPDHHVIVACLPETQGAYASCVEDPRYFGDWAIERLKEGALLQRVPCDKAHAMRLEYMEWCAHVDEFKDSL